MRKLYIATALMLAGSMLQAQSLSHTVEVTNAYKREASGIDKPSQLLPLPDSVSRFNYDFDYTVRSTPYRGSYEFKPYNVLLRPSARPSSEGTLYASLGAGYGFHPEAEVVWTPVASEKLHVNLYGDYKAYMGNYRDIAFDGEYFKDSGAKTDGWKDRVLRAGVDACMDWTRGSLWGDLRYTGTAGSDVWADVSTHGVSLDGGLKGSIPAGMVYKMQTHVNYAGNALLNEFHTVTEGGIGFRAWSGSAGLQLMAETLSFDDGTLTGFAGNFAVTPFYALVLGKKLQLNAGVKVAFLLRDNAAFCPTKGGVLYPDVHASFSLIDEAMVLQAAVTGGNALSSFEEALGGNHFLGSFGFTPDVTLERLNVMMGARGNVKERIHYNIKAGYSLKENALGYGYSAAAAGYTPVMGYMCPLNSLYVGGTFGWKGDKLDVDANLRYQYTFTPKPQTALQQNLFGPPAFRGDASAMYRFFGGRLKAGATLDTMTERPSMNAKLPGYVDLGLKTSFAVNRYWGAWLKVGNLLNQSVQRTPFHAERGIWVSVGASMTI